MSVPELLADLLTAAGGPGQESAPAGVWREAAEAFGADVTVDAMGTSVARVGGRGEHPLLAVVGHIDEIAVLVSHVSDKGFLHVVGSGGWDPQVLVGQRVEVLTRKGPVPGVVGRKPIHLLEAEERKKAVELKKLHVDIGARGRRRGARAGVRGRPDRDRRRAAGAAERPPGLALARQPAGRVRGARGGPPRARGGRRRRPGGGRGGRAGGDRRARRPRDGLRAPARPGRGGGRDARHRRPGRGARRARPATAWAPGP